MTQEGTQDLIHRLPLWRGAVEIEPLPGGMTNRNYLVRDAGRKCVVRIGGDIPMHGIMRFNEHAVSRAAAAAGLSPQVLYTEPGLSVIDYIEGHTLQAADVRDNPDRCVALVSRLHNEVAPHLRGPVLAFNVFHVLRNYAHTLIQGDSPYVPQLPRLSNIAAEIEKVVGRTQLVLGHNDLVAANIIDDGDRLWVIDWDYAGFSPELFDLCGLSFNNGFTEDDNEAMLTAYFARPVGNDLRLRFHAMLVAATLREMSWSMVSELYPPLELDYAAYTAENAARFESSYAAFLEMGGKV